MSGFSDAQARALKGKLPRPHVRTRRAGDCELSYIEGWYAIAEANRIFGFDAWHRETLELTRCLAQAPARTLAELELKIAVLCNRLRDDMRPEIRGEVLTWMLAESISHDYYLIAPTRPTTNRN